ncbi:MAG TPA: MBL fold metallo-hydrolase [Vicinamibacterales bacterium]|jgi:glyoxylase-like metal-dependent hydrolase (beta-lactamase superfamily II)|nr:MBL fold metallo-hydrolase [Vicinamibacterales bacterium]
MHKKIVDAVRALSPLPIRYLVNTHLHGDHTAGNAAMAKLGAVIVPGHLGPIVGFRESNSS